MTRVPETDDETPMIVPINNGRPASPGGTPSNADGPPPAKLLLSPRQAAEALSISERKLWSLTASGEIGCVRIGRMVRYAVQDLHSFIEKQRQATWR